MPVISTCPNCERQVTIPDGVGADTQVRCPICDSEYPLREAMAAVPPALIPLDTGMTQDLVAEPEGLAEAEGDLVLESDAEFVLQPEVDLAGESEVVAEQPGAEVGRPAAEGPELDVWQGVSETPEIDIGLADETPAAVVDAEAFAGFGDEDESEGEAEPVGREPPRPRRKRKKQKSVLKEIVGAIVGGILGLVVGYYLLNYFGGPRFDFMEFYLPGVPHTYKHKTGADQAKAEKPRAKVEEPAALKFPEPKPLPELPSNASTDLPQLLSVEPQVEAPVGVPESEPKRKSLPADYVGPRDPPSFTPDQLGKALKEVNNLLVREDPAAATSHQTYGKLCELGHVLAFVDRDAQGGQLADRVQAIRDILQQMGDAPGRFDEMGRSAGSLLESKDGTKGGVLLAGTAGKAGSQGGLHGTIVELADHPMKVTVMSNRPLSISTDDKALILGSIVGYPAENVVGYSGSKELLIWVGTVVKVAE